MTDKKALAVGAANLVIFALTSVAASAVTQTVMKKIDQRHARKEAAANLCLNED